MNLLLLSRKQIETVTESKNLHKSQSVISYVGLWQYMQHDSFKWKTKINIAYQKLMYRNIRHVEIFGHTKVMLEKCIHSLVDIYFSSCNTLYVCFAEYCFYLYDNNLRGILQCILSLIVHIYFSSCKICLFRQIFVAFTLATYADLTR